MNRFSQAFILVIRACKPWQTAFMLNSLTEEVQSEELWLLLITSNGSLVVFLLTTVTFKMVEHYRHQCLNKRHVEYEM